MHMYRLFLPNSAVFRDSCSIRAMLTYLDFSKLTLASFVSSMEHENDDDVLILDDEVTIEFERAPSTEDLFRRINKTISKNSKVKVGDEDLNKVRAYVVQSNLPISFIFINQVSVHCRQYDCYKENVKREKLMRSLTVRKNRSLVMRRSSRLRRTSSRRSSRR